MWITGRNLNEALEVQGSLLQLFLLRLEQNVFPYIKKWRDMFLYSAFLLYQNTLYNLPIPSIHVNTFFSMQVLSNLFLLQWMHLRATRG